MAGRGEAAGVSRPVRLGRRSASSWSCAVLEAGSEKAAAHRLGLSHSTVKHHLANARSKVGAETTAQLVWILAAGLQEPGKPLGTNERQSAHTGGDTGRPEVEILPAGPDRRSS